MIQGREIELGLRRFAARKFLRIVFAAGRDIGMRQVRDDGLQRVDLVIQLIVRALGGFFLFPQPAGLFDQLVACVGIFGLTDCLRNVVGLLVQVLRLVQRFQTSLFEFGDSIDIAIDSAAKAILANQIDILDDEFSIEHMIR
jgi:hypothetical protein